MSVYSQPESNMATSPNTPPQEKSLGELFGDLTRETTQLVRQEVNLAKAELTAKATRVGKDVGMIAVGGFVAYVGLLALVGALIFGLVALGLKSWAAALIVGLIFCGGGAMLAMQGISALKRVDPLPRQTIETLKEDQQWAKAQR
jgi:hypothetical protein